MNQLQYLHAVLNDAAIPGVPDDTNTMPARIRGLVEAYRAECAAHTDTMHDFGELRNERAHAPYCHGSQKCKFLDMATASRDALNDALAACNVGRRNAGDETDASLFKRLIGEWRERHAKDEAENKQLSDSLANMTRLRNDAEGLAAQNDNAERYGKKLAAQLKAIRTTIAAGAPPGSYSAHALLDMVEDVTGQAAEARGARLTEKLATARAELDISRVRADKAEGAAAAFKKTVECSHEIINRANIPGVRGDIGMLRERIEDILAKLDEQCDTCSSNDPLRSAMELAELQRDEANARTATIEAALRGRFSEADGCAKGKDRSRTPVGLTSWAFKREVLRQAMDEAGIATPAVEDGNASDPE